MYVEKQGIQALSKTQIRSNHNRHSRKPTNRHESHGQDTEVWSEVYERASRYDSTGEERAHTTARPVSVEREA